MSDIEKADELAIFLQMQLEELLEMPDEDVLDAANTVALKSENLAMVAASKAEAGRRRMAAAKAGMTVRKATNVSTVPQVSLNEARAFLETAMNDTRYTLAARSLGEMSDDDIFRLYSQLNQLKLNESHGNGKR